MISYTVARGDKVLGDFTDSQIVSMLKSGEIQKTDLVYTEGFETWKTISDVPELIPSMPIPIESKPKLTKLVLLGGVLLG